MPKESRYRDYRTLFTEQELRTCRLCDHVRYEDRGRFCSVSGREIPDLDAICTCAKRPEESGV